MKEDTAIYIGFDVHEVQKASTVPSSLSRPMPVGFATSLTIGQGFCFIVGSWTWRWPRKLQ